MSALCNQVGHAVLDGKCIFCEEDVLSIIVRWRRKNPTTGAWVYFDTQPFPSKGHFEEWVEMMRQSCPTFEIREVHGL